MNKRFACLALRRLELRETIAAQRKDLAEITQQWHNPLAIADVGVKALHLVYRHPALVAGVMTAVLAWRRNGIAGLAKNGWRLLYLYPSAIFLGLKYLASATHASTEEPD